MKAVDYRLYSRNIHLYYRYVLPRPLQLVFPHKEIKVSLSTQDIALARLYVAKLDIEIQSLINQIYNATDIEAIRTLVTDGIEGMKGKVGLPQRKSLNFDLLSHGAGGTQQSFSFIAQEYLKDCVTNSPKTIEHKRQTYEMFQSICGDLAFKTITKVEARQFKAMMLRMPDVSANRRPPFTMLQLHTLFSCPIYKGCKGVQPKERLEIGRLVVKVGRNIIPF